LTITREFPPPLKEKLSQFKEKILKNRALIRLRTDISLGRSLESFKVGKPDPKAFPELLKRLEFRGSIYGLEGEAGEAGLATNKIRKVHTVLSERELSLLEEALASSPRISYDLETDSSDPHHCSIVGVSLSHKINEAWYIPIGHRDSGSLSQLKWEKVKPLLKSILETEKIIKCGQNVKFDNSVLIRFGIEPRDPIFDTMIASYCLNPERLSFGLKSLAADFLGEKMTSFKELVGKDKDATIAQVPIEKAAAYAGADAEVVFRLVDLFEGELKKGNLQDLFLKFEMPLVRVLQKMESSGIVVHTQQLNDLRKNFMGQMEKLEGEIYTLAGETFNLNSPKQLSRILFEKLNLPTIKKTKTGFSTNEMVLSKLAPKHPICQKILDYRGLSKLVSTYVDSLLNQVDPSTGRVHTSFHQTGTSTGRLSSSEPNLQNIPIRTEQGREIRRAFVPSEGNVFLSADYSQIDLRALAHMSEDPVLVGAFQSGGDIHAATAADVFHVSIDKVTPDMRRKAKAINFGIVYGQQAWGLSQSLGIEVEEAQAFIDHYFDRYAGVKSWIDKTLKEARKNGFVSTVAGRRRRVGDINSDQGNVRGFAERIAINTPIQGSSADIIKAAMISIFKEFREKGLKSQMLVQVHDELLFDVRKNELENVIPLVKEGMEKSFPLRVPLLVDMKMGSNWTDMEKL